MKSYDEITNQVLETAQVRTVKLKRLRYASTTAVVCLCCVIGGAAFMKLEKPEIKPSDRYTEESSDSLHSASDPSTEETAETTEEPTTETTPVQTTLPETTVATTLATTTTFMTEPEEEVIVTELVPIYVENGAAPVIMTSIPGETHTAQTTKHTSTTAKPAETTAESITETVPETTETDPVETESAQTDMTTAATDAVAAETTATEETSETDIPATVETEEVSEETDVPSEEPQKETLPPIPLDKWKFLYELYFNGELPFDLELLTEDATEEEIISLFPELFPDAIE